MTDEEVLQLVRHLIGSRYVPSVETYMAELTMRTVGRFTGEVIRAPGTSCPGRLNLCLNATGDIEAIDIDGADESQA